MTGAVVIFARSPERGRVKTRLAAAVGDDAALALHRAFLSDTLEAVRRAGARSLLAATPSSPFAEQALADATFHQRGEGFAARFDATLADARRRAGPDAPLIVLGVDTPHLPPSRIRSALGALRRAPAVLGPGEREGFWLVGFAGTPVALSPALGRPGELEMVKELLGQGGAVPKVLGPFWDVDLPADLDRLGRELSARASLEDAWVPPATWRTLQGLGLARDGAHGP